MPSLLSRPPAVGFLTAFLGASLAIVLISGCNRSSSAVPTTPAAADTAKAAGKEKGAAPVAAATADGKAASSAAGGASAAPNPAMAKRAADAEKEKARQAAAEMVPVETALVTRGAISSFLPFNATLETESTVDIFPQIGGQVEALLVEEGAVVREGDALLKIEDRELRIDVEDTQTNFDHLLKTFARTEDLFKRSLVNKQDFEDQRFHLEQARLRLERAKVRLAYATVRAPFDGVVSARETQVGARVGSGTKLFSMVKLDDLVARVFVPGRYLTVVAEKQPAIVTSEFLPDRSFTGWVKRISPVIDPKSGTFKVTVGVKTDKPTELPPGLFVGVRIVTDTRPNAVLIPKRAVVYEGGERYVFTVEKNRAMKRKLPVGYEDPSNVEALTGFEVGTAVIVLGQSGLKDGQMVRSVNSPPASAVAAAAPGAGARPNAESTPPPPTRPTTSPTVDTAKAKKS